MTSQPPRDTAAMRLSPRCGAKTRQGTPCRAPAVAGRRRCRMHGGAAGSGAPLGNRNAVTHGFYTEEARAARAEQKALLRAAYKTLHELS